MGTPQFWGATVKSTSAATFDPDDAGGGVLQLSESEDVCVFLEVEGFPRYAIAKLNSKRCPNVTLGNLKLFSKATFTLSAPSKSAEVSITGHVVPDPLHFACQSEEEDNLFDFPLDSSDDEDSAKSAYDSGIEEVTDAEAERIMSERAQAKTSLVGIEVSSTIQAIKPLGKLVSENQKPNDSTSDKRDGQKKAASQSKKGVKSIKTEKEKNDGQKENDKSSDNGATPPLTKQRSLPGGIKIETLSLKPSNGDAEVAKVGSRVKVRYKGSLVSNQKVFDQGTLQFTVGAGDMIRGFDLGTKGMVVGETRRVFVPSQLAYKTQRVGTIPPNSDLIFDISLLAVQ